MRANAFFLGILLVLGQAAVAAEKPAALGPAGRDEQGRPGRVHTVTAGDTLWGISERYYGTPWVWPSVWRGNDDKVANPHRIYPGNRLWISDGEMRRVSDAEAEALLGRQADQAVPAALEDTLAAQNTEDKKDWDIFFSAAEMTGLVTQAELDSAARVLGSSRDTELYAHMDPIYISLGEGEVLPGEQFTLFRRKDLAYDPETGKVFGRFVDVLGWAEVTEVHADSAVAEIRQAYDAIEKGDLLVPREKPVRELHFVAAPEGLEGQILFLADQRTSGAGEDVVYLNRGEEHGVQVGQRLEVFRSLTSVVDRETRQKRQLPDQPLADLLVVKIGPRTSVALVTHAVSDLSWGDHFRRALQQP